MSPMYKCIGSWKNTGVHTIYASVTFDDDEKVKREFIAKGSQRLCSQLCTV